MTLAITRSVIPRKDGNDVDMYQLNIPFIHIAGTSGNMSRNVNIPLAS